MSDDLITRLRNRHDIGLHYILTEAADEIERLRAAAQQARAALVDAEHALTKARIWGGTEWHYNPLHQMCYVPALEKLQVALKDTP